MIMNEEIVANSESELTDLLTQSVVSVLQDALVKKGSASLVVSGGGTPKPLFERLSHVDLDWSKVTITLADERWVDNTSADSNECMIRNTLLKNNAATALFVPLKNSSHSAKEGCLETSRIVKEIQKPFDLVILGMGNDGHTASFFPYVSSEATDLSNQDVCMAIKPLEASHERITLTAKTLAESKRIFLHIVGDEKWGVYQKAQQPGEIDEMPVRSILRQKVSPVTVFWSS